MMPIRDTFDTPHADYGLENSGDSEEGELKVYSSRPDEGSPVPTIGALRISRISHLNEEGERSFFTHGYESTFEFPLLSQNSPYVDPSALPLTPETRLHLSPSGTPNRSPYSGLGSSNRSLSSPPSPYNFPVGSPDAMTGDFTFPTRHSHSPIYLEDYDLAQRGHSPSYYPPYSDVIYDNEVGLFLGPQQGGDGLLSHDVLTRQIGNHLDAPQAHPIPGSQLYLLRRPLSEPAADPVKELPTKETSYSLSAASSPHATSQLLLPYGPEYQHSYGSHNSPTFRALYAHGYRRYSSRPLGSSAETVLALQSSPTRRYVSRGSRRPEPDPPVKTRRANHQRMLLPINRDGSRLAPGRQNDHEDYHSQSFNILLLPPTTSRISNGFNNRSGNSLPEDPRLTPLGRRIRYEPLCPEGMQLRDVPLGTWMPDIPKLQVVDPAIINFYSRDVETEQELLGIHIGHYSSRGMEENDESKMSWLVNPDETVLPNSKTKGFTIHFLWPGYQKYSYKMSIHRSLNKFQRKDFPNQVKHGLRQFFQNAKESEDTYGLPASEIENWRIKRTPADDGRVTLEDLRLLRLSQVTKGSWNIRFAAVVPFQ